MPADLYGAIIERLLVLISPTRVQHEVVNTKEEWSFLTICVFFCGTFHNAVSVKIIERSGRGIIEL